MRAIPSQTIDWVTRFHAAVDEASAPVAAANASRLRCKSGCADCCIDDVTVFEIEAAVIEHHHAELLANAEPHPDGACAFLDPDNKSCRIYAQRPYVCRTQGLPLRWLEEDELEEEIIESRDICPLNIEGGPALDELASDHCWTLGPFEQRLADEQAKIDLNEDKTATRVSLRSLFAKNAPASLASPFSKRRLPVR